MKAKLFLLFLLLLTQFLSASAQWNPTGPLPYTGQGNKLYVTDSQLFVLGEPSHRYVDVDNWEGLTISIRGGISKFNGEYYASSEGSNGNAVIYKSPDGESWEFSWDFGVSRLDNLISTGTALYGVVNNNLYVTQNGVDWVETGDPSIRQFDEQVYAITAVAGRDDYLIVGTSKGFYVSTGKGTKWADHKLFDSDGVVHKIISDPSNIWSDPSNIWIYALVSFKDVNNVTTYYIYLSQDRGETWTKSPAWYNPQITDIAVSNGVLFAVIGSNVNFSLNQGRSWDSRGGSGQNEDNFLAVANGNLYASISTGEVMYRPLHEFTPPTIFTSKVNYETVTTYTAEISGEGSAYGFNTRFYFEFGEDQNNLNPINASESIKTNNYPFKHNLTNLKPNTNYYYRLVGEREIDNKIEKGNLEPFTTLALPVLKTEAVTVKTATTATLPGTVTANGNTVTGLKFEYGLSETSLTLDTIEATPPTTTIDTSVSADITDLQPDTRYYYQLTGTDAGGTPIQGNVLSFSTSALPAPTLTAEKATSIAASTAKLLGKVTINGNTVTELKFQYGKTKELSSEIKANPESIVNDSDVSADIKDLEPSTTYYYRLAGTYSGDTVTSPINEFITLPPTIIPEDATDVTASRATLRGKVSAFNYLTILQFEYGTDSTKLTITNGNPSSTTLNDVSVSIDIKDLEPFTTYYFRLVGTKTEGNNVRVLGKIKSFTTLKPTILTEDTSQVTANSATLWGKASTFGYNTVLHFEYAKDPTQLKDIKGTAKTANPPITTLDNVSVSIDIKDLEPVTTYYYRLVGTKTQGNNVRVEGDIKWFTTKDIKDKIAFKHWPTQITSNSNQIKGDSVVISLLKNIPNPNSIDVKLFTRSITGIAWNQERMNLTGNSNEYTALLPANQFDALGLIYYVQVKLSATDSFATQKNIVAIDYEDGLSFPFEVNYSRAREDYEIIAFPLQLRESANGIIKSFLGVYDRRYWRVVTYKKIGDSQWEEHVDFINFKPGKGYWILADPKKAKDKSFRLNTGAGTTVVNMPAFKDSVFIIPLQNGWNQIGNPYPFHVKWKDILEASESSSTKNIEWYVYRNKTWLGPNTAEELEAFRGAFVYSDTEQAELRIPVRPINKSKGGRVGVDETAQHDSATELDIQFTLQHGEQVYTLGGLGMHTNAQVSKDPFDRMLIPRIGRYLDISFDHPEHAARLFTKDMVPVAPNYIWEFNVATSRNSGNVTLSWETYQKNTNTLQLWLHDLVTDRIVDMANQVAYTFQAGHNQAFRVYCGDAYFIEEKAKPLHIRLGKPFPNPFDHTTTIPLTLIEADDIYQVKVQVYNVQGLQVATLAAGNFKAGFHQLNWNGIGHSGRRLAAGLYILVAEVVGAHTKAILQNKLILK